MMELKTFYSGYLYVCIGADGKTTGKGGGLTDLASNFSIPKAVMPDPWRKIRTVPEYLTNKSQDPTDSFQPKFLIPVIFCVLNSYPYLPSNAKLKLVQSWLFLPEVNPKDVLVNQENATHSSSV